MAEVAAPRIKVQSPPESAQEGMSFSPPSDGGVIITREAEHRNSSDSRPQSNGKGFPSKLIRPRTGNRTSSFSNSEGGRNSSSALDPLSAHIIERTRDSTPQRIRTGQIGQNDGTDDGGISPTSPSKTSTEPPMSRTDTSNSSNRESNKKNRVSFLSRFMAKRRDSVDPQEEEQDITDPRAEGAEAETFSQPIGYIPKYPEPPKYIKVRAKGKKEKDFDRVFLAQELRGRTGVEVAKAGGRKINPAQRAKQGDAIWALEFSKDGKFLAAGGHDHIVRVWTVLATEEDRLAHERQEEQSKDDAATKLSAPVFKASPVQEYEGHTATVLDLSWSKNNFLLSSSMDKTVRLWHTSRAECLCAFKHSDFVTSIQFHPRDDRFFLAGSLDSKLRLWSIPDKSVAHWVQPSELITSVAFTPDGKTAIAGCLSGACIFYETEGLRQQTQMHVRSAHGKNSKGSKITGIQTLNYPPTDPNGEVKVLVTSNDSRVRVYNLRDKSLELKLKGAENTSSQIRASFSDDARYIISGSEDKKAYIWSTGPPEKDKDKRPMEMFEAHNSNVTAAVMAPSRTRQLLQTSGDPLFELCNPPPIQLISRSGSHSSKGQADSHAESESIPATPSFPKRPEESPAWVARSAHPNGNIIITADFEGHIKVFRQDCAYKQRLRNNDNWDAGSTFSRKVLNRSSSITTRASKRSARDSHGHPSDRILSWRQSIDRSSASPSMNSSHDAFPLNSPARSSFARSISPRKSFPSNNSMRKGSGAASTTHPLSASSTPSIQPAPSFVSSTHSADTGPTASQNTASAANNARTNNSNTTTTTTTTDASSTLSKARTRSPHSLAVRSARGSASNKANPNGDNNNNNSSTSTSNNTNRLPTTLTAADDDDSNPLMILDSSGASAAFYDPAQYEGLVSTEPRRRSLDINGNAIDGRSVRSTDESADGRSSSRGGGYRNNNSSNNNGGGGGGGGGSSRSRNRGAGADVDSSGHLKRPTGFGRGGGGGSGHGSENGGISSAASEVSVLSIEMEEESEGDEGERCRRCGSENFKSRRRGGNRVLECVRCGKVVE